MNKNTKIVIVAVIAIIVIAGIWYGASRKPAEKEVIKIGAILPLTVKATNLGEDAKQAIELAIEKINKENMLMPKIEIVFEDDKCDPKEAMSTYQSLRLRGIKLIIGSICSPAFLAIAPLAEKEKVILITPGAGADEISQAGDFIFRNHVTVTQKTEKLAKFAVQKFNSLATIYDNSNDFFVKGDKIMSEVFSEQEKNVLVREGFAQNATDFRTQLSKIKSKNPEVIYIGGLMPQAAIIVKQIKEMEISAQIVGDDGFITDKKFLEAVGDSVEGIIFAATDFERKNNPEFWDLYIERFGKNPTIFGAQAYDTLMILAKIIKESCNNGDPTCTKNELYKIQNYPGVSGTTSFDQNGDAQKEVILKTVKNGQFVPYGE